VVNLAPSAFDWIRAVSPLISKEVFLKKNRDHLVRRHVVSSGNIFNRPLKIAKQVADRSSQFCIWLKLAKGNS
jgi:hypothetical protein